MDCENCFSTRQQWSQWNRKVHKGKTVFRLFLKFRLLLRHNAFELRFYCVFLLYSSSKDLSQSLSDFVCQVWIPRVLIILYQIHKQMDRQMDRWKHIISLLKGNIRFISRKATAYTMYHCSGNFFHQSPSIQWYNTGNSCCSILNPTQPNISGS